MSTSRARTVPLIAGLFIGLVLVIAGAVALRSWRAGSAFCDAVHSVPSVATAIDRAQSPAEGLLHHADGLAVIAAVAPDTATRDAAAALAAAERAAAAALAGGPTNADTVSAIATAASPQAASARDTLQASVAQRCG